MEFRPCIDIHNGKVKQIVGGSLSDGENSVVENFVADQDGVFFASFYKRLGLKGGHVILLNAEGSELYEQTKAQAVRTLKAYPGGLQAGGGITPENACAYLEAGASHVIITSYVFRDGCIQYDRLDQIVRKVGRKHLVLDLSCRKKNNQYYIVTDRWQRYTQVVLSEQILERLSEYCDEFLVHAVDAEGKSEGIEEPLIKILGNWGGNPITYAGGVHSLTDLYKIKESGKNRIHVTIGSALDLFGGNLKLEEVLKYIKD